MCTLCTIKHDNNNNNKQPADGGKLWSLPVGEGVLVTAWSGDADVCTEDLARVVGLCVGEGWPDRRVEDVEGGVDGRAELATVDVKVDWGRLRWESTEVLVVGGASLIDNDDDDDDDDVVVVVAVDDDDDLVVDLVTEVWGGIGKSWTVERARIVDSGFDVVDTACLGDVGCVLDVVCVVLNVELVDVDVFCADCL